MKEHVIEITPEGNIVCVYNDDYSFLRDGELALQRASNVRWDQEEQAWYVFIVTDKGEDRIQLPFTRRKDAIGFEVAVLNEGLLSGTHNAHKLFSGGAL